MNNYILAGISFVAGAAVSGITAWIVAKKRYERIHQEEMNVVWNDIQKNSKIRDDEIKPKEITPEELDAKTDSRAINIPNMAFEKPDLANYATKVREFGYNPDDKETTNDYIFEIDYSDLDEDEYQGIDLVLYADGILTDDMDVPLRSAIDAVGDHYVEMMAGKDEIFIRNEKRKIDYDIVRSELTFGEQIDRHPETEQRIQYDEALEDYYKNEDEDEEDE